MKGYVEISAKRVIEAVNNYEAKEASNKKEFNSIKKRLESIIHKGWFYSHTEWDNCHSEDSFWLSIPRWLYIKKHHPELLGIYRSDWYGSKKDTSEIKALALEGVLDNVLCNEELALFVMENA